MSLRKTPETIEIEPASGIPSASLPSSVVPPPSSSASPSWMKQPWPPISASALLAPVPGWLGAAAAAAAAATSATLLSAAAVIVLKAFSKALALAITFSKKSSMVALASLKTPWIGACRRIRSTNQHEIIRDAAKSTPHVVCRAASR